MHSLKTGHFFEIAVKVVLRGGCGEIGLIDISCPQPEGEALVNCDYSIVISTFLNDEPVLRLGTLS